MSDFQIGGRIKLTLDGANEVKVFFDRTKRGAADAADSVAEFDKSLAKLSGSAEAAANVIGGELAAKTKRTASLLEQLDVRPQLVRNIKAAQAELDRLEDIAKSASASTKEALGSVRAGLIDQIKQATNELGKLNATAQAQGGQVVGLGGGGLSRGGGAGGGGGADGAKIGLDVVGQGSTLGGALGSLGGGGGGQAVGDLLGFIESFGKFGQELQALGVKGSGAITALGGAMAKAIPIIGGVALGIAIVQKGFEDAARAFRATTDGLREGARLAATGSKEALEAKLKEAQENVKAAQAAKGVSEQIRKGIEDRLGGPALAGAVAGIYGYGEGLQAQTDAIKDANAEIAKNEAVMRQLEKALADTEGIAKRTAAAISDEFAKAFELGTTGRTFDLQKLIQDQLANGTSEGIADQLAAIDRERKAITDGYNLTLQSVGGDLSKLSEQQQRAVQEQINQFNILEERANALRGIQDQVAQRDAEKAAADELSAAIEEEIGIRNQARTATLEAVEARKLAIDEEIAIIKEFAAQSGGLTKEQQDRIDKLGQERLAIAQTIEPEARRRQALEDSKKALEESTKKLQEFNQVSGQIRTLEADRTRALEERAITDKRAAEEAALTREIAAAREADAAKQSAQKITDIRKNAAKAETDATTKYLTDVAKVNRDFMASEMKAVDQFRREEARRTQDYNRERVRRLEDLYTELTDLAARGDVAGFIGASRAGERDLRRGAEDFQTEGQRGAEDFAREREEARAARDAQLADLRASFEQERAARAAQLQAQLAQEQAAQQQAAQARISQADILEKRLAALREGWAKEDAARRRRIEDENFRAQMDALKQRQAQLSPIVANALNPAVEGIKRFGEAAGNYLRNLANVVSSARIGSRGGGGASGGGGGPLTATANATGGIYDKPTFAMLGEARQSYDVVIPVQKSEGISAALARYAAQAGTGAGGAGGGRPISVNVNMTVGDVASGNMVRAELEMMQDQILDAIAKAPVQGVE